MMTSATATASVCSRAMAEASSVLVENHDSTIAGVMTLDFGPTSKIDAPSSRTLAMNSSSRNFLFYRWRDIEAAMVNASKTRPGS